MARIICLANSRRPGGRCVAGIDTETGQWVRPVLKGNGAIPDRMTLFGNHQLAPLDIIECDLSAPHLMTKYQRENSIVTSSRFRLMGAVTSSGVLKYCSEKSVILHGHTKVVEPALLDGIAPEQWASLELRRLPRVKFEPDDKKPGRWVASFRAGGTSGASYSLRVTDPVAEERLKGGEDLNGEWLATISLTEPISYPEYNLPALCYKLVAALMPIGNKVKGSPPLLPHRRPEQ